MSKIHKKYKVRRFGRIYSSRRSTPAIVLRTVLTITMVFVLGFVGWNAYGPVRDYFSGALAAAAAAKKQDTPSPAASQGEPEPEQAVPPAEPEPPAQLHALYLPAAMLERPLLDTLLSQPMAETFNAVLFDLKDASGRVYYQSGLDSVAQAGSQTEDALDLRELCGYLTGKGLVPMARITVFADPLASARLTGAGVKYMNTDMQWLDNAQENGGKGWLNPYAEPAKAYLTDIVAEAASMGVKRIVLDQYSFPTGVGLEFANFGELEGSIARAVILQSVVDALEQAAETRDCTVSLYVSGPAALGGMNQYYGGQNPLSLSDEITLGVMPAQFGDGYALEDFTLESPITQPYETVKAVLEQVSPALSGKHVTAMLQGYTATGSLANNKVYQLADIAEQRRALTELGVENDILYSPGGNYPAE